MDTLAANTNERGEHPELSDFGGNYNYRVGSKYSRAAGIVDIANSVRVDIKEAVKAGRLPNAKYSVSIQRYSGGQSLNVVVKDVPEGFAVINAASLLVREANPRKFFEERQHPRLTAEATATLETLEAIVAQYNYDRSDIQSDYFDVNFYRTVKFGWELEKRQAESIRAPLVA